MEVDLHVHAGWHDNVVNLRGLAYHGGHTYLVMELCPRGTLDLLIHSQGGASKMDPCKLLPIVRSIARGMLHLHTRSPPILHRDLKPANIFIGHGYVMKIGDFGMARYGCDTRAYRAAMAPRPPPFDETAIKSFSKTNMVPGPTLMRTLTPGVIGTAAYSAPELLNPDSPPDQPLDNHGDGDDGGGGCAALHEDQQEFDTEKLLKADVYAFGVLLWELMERQRPHAGMDGFQVQTQWVLEPASMKLRPPRVPEGLPPQQKQIMEALSSLVMQCTAWDPEIRPSFKRILSILKEASKQDAEQQLHGQQLASPF
jgi:serine/threonine protein kinase